MTDSPAHPWHPDDHAAALATCRSKAAREAARAVLDWLHGCRPDDLTCLSVEARPLSVKVAGYQRNGHGFGVDVRRDGSLRAWADVESHTFYEADHRWEQRGTNVDVVMLELAAVVGLRPQTSTSGRRAWSRDRPRPASEPGGTRCLGGRDGVRAD